MSPLIQGFCIITGFLFFLHIQGTTALMCYDCNSEYDPRCGDPFQPYSIGEVNCSKQEPLEHLKDKYKPTLCRKTVQKVYGKVRVVRGCGYIPDERDDRQCMKRLGTHDVQALYCACTKDLCNGAQSTLMIDSNNLLRALPLAFSVIIIILSRNFNVIHNYL